MIKLSTYFLRQRQVLAKISIGLLFCRGHQTNVHSKPLVCFDPTETRDRFLYKLQALVCDILPSTTAVFSYAIGQLFVGAQTVVSLLQTTKIKQGVSFIAANKVYTSTNKTTIV